MSYKIAIYVQHLLGAGHLVRAMSLAEALAGYGHQVLLLSGGFAIAREIKGYDYYQLPPTRAIGGDFNRLVDEQDKPIDDSWRQHRAQQLLEVVEAFSPDLLITETYPFGRRQFRFELTPLLEWVKSRGSVRLFASIRDVLQRRSEEKNRRTVALVAEFYDAVLVHGDERLFSLAASFALADEIEDQLIYTGYIHQPPGKSDEASSSSDGLLTGQDEVIVSGGSGTVSAQLLKTACQARHLSRARGRVWRLLTGRDQSTPSRQPEPGLIIEPNRADFYDLLCRCRLSISQAGYNTTLDILASGASAVLVPFAGDGETEQSDRARALERAGRVVQLPEAQLGAKSLAQSIDRALDLPTPVIEVSLDGAQKSAEIITQRMDQWQT